jgi:hypothetical protein
MSLSITASLAAKRKLHGARLTRDVEVPFIR